MKKGNFYATLFLVVICMFMFSCSEEENASDYNKLIVGKWQLAESTVSDINVCDFEDWISFNQDGTITNYDAYNNVVKKNSGTWNINENVVTIESNNTIGMECFEIKELTSTKLVMGVSSTETTEKDCINTCKKIN